MSPSRFYVQSKVYDRFAAKFIETMSSTRVGDGLEKATQMGPLAHARRMDVMQAFVEDARSAGAIPERIIDAEATLRAYLE